jgi:LPS-assembly protein
MTVWPDHCGCSLVRAFVGGALGLLGLLALASAGAQAQSTAAASAPSVTFEADRISGRLEQDVTLEGDVLLQREPFTLNADRVDYSIATAYARARGNVRARVRGDRYSGSELQLNVERAEGFVLDPTYRFERTRAGGRAKRIDFLGENRFTAEDADYTSCPPEEPGDDAPWILKMRRVRIDFDRNEGLAEGAVVRFYGVPILAAPVLSFPVTDARKSGWLPPSIDLSNTRGLEFGVPYYWNIAPNHDATLTPVFSTRRGFALDSEYRYLQRRWRGQLNLFALPDDRVALRDRHALRWQHEGHLPRDLHYDWQVLRVSDNDYWKDGLRGADNLTPRLLPSSAQLQRRGDVSLGDTALGRARAYARTQRWQVLQDVNAPIDAPHRREPQIGLRYEGERAGFEWALETEYNRFTHEDLSFDAGARVHGSGYVAHPFGNSGWRLTPKLGFTSVNYDLDRRRAGGSQATRLNRQLPTVSVDSVWSFERETDWRGRAVTQTLEPRLLYVRTPYRNQAELPNFDSAGNDFNFTSVFAENAFSGIDRISDANQLTAGMTTRLIDVQTGAEAARFGVAQRYLFRDQRVTPDGQPLTQRFSDVLLLGSTTALPRWTLDGTLQFSPQTDRFVRTIASARYSPGEYRTVNLIYRLARGASEQLEVGWQWPLNGPQGLYRSDPSQGKCRGTLYSVGRIDHSLRDKRITDAIAGFEYDAGCWIGRIVAERRSTALNASTNKLSIQLELVGLSRLALGSNPLRLLKDNIPGYSPLRGDFETPWRPPRGRLPPRRHDDLDDAIAFTCFFRAVAAGPGARRRAPGRGTTVRQQSLRRLHRCGRQPGAGDQQRGAAAHRARRAGRRAREPTPAAARRVAPDGARSTDRRTRAAQPGARVRPAGGRRRTRARGRLGRAAESVDPAANARTAAA